MWWSHTILILNLDVTPTSRSGYRRDGPTMDGWLMTLTTDDYRGVDPSIYRVVVTKCLYSMFSDWGRSRSIVEPY